MSQIQQASSDLEFVRAAVARKATQPTPAPILLLWATYVVVGYTAIDFAPRFAGWWFLICGFLFGALSAVLGKRAHERAGEVDHDHGRRAMLHWFAGMVLTFAAAFALAAVIPELRGPKGSQVLVVMIGLLYFLAGVHLDRQFLWLGPVLMAGGILVGSIPRYPWTCLGAVIALGLIAPIFFRRTARPA